MKGVKVSVVGEGVIEDQSGHLPPFSIKIKKGMLDDMGGDMSGHILFE